MISANHLPPPPTPRTNLVEQVPTDGELENHIQARNIPLCLLLALDNLVVDKLEDVGVPQRLVHLHLLLQLLYVWRAVPQRRGDEEVDNFARCYAALCVVDCAEDSAGG